MTQGLSRRQFLGCSAAASVALGGSGCLSIDGWLVQRPLPAVERPRIACIGVGLQGWFDAQAMAASGGEIVALCDVAEDLPRWVFLMKDATRLFPKAARYRDYRVMLDEMGDAIDAVVVSTPDHVHGHAAVTAMRQGKAVYVQKPLARSIGECRMLLRVARETGVVTQMGNQAHAGDVMRRAVELIRAGAVGRAREIHVWTNRPIWPQGMQELPKPRLVPDDFDWNLWLGPAPERAFADGYHPFDWRGWWDFGTGALGDMGCHILDLPWWALELGPPTRISASQVAGASAIAAPEASVIEYRFDAGRYSDDLSLYWYDGGRLPDIAHFEGLDVKARHLDDWDGLLIGSDGKLLFERSDGFRVFPAAREAELAEVPRTLPRVASHAVEWIDAIRGGPRPLSSFEVSAPFSEMVLAGNLPLQLGRDIEWDGEAARAINAPDAEPWIRPRYRAGWEL